MAYQVRREYTPVNSPKHNGVAERGHSNDAGACDGFLPGGPSPVRWRPSATDGTSLGGGMRLRLQCPQHDDEGGGLAGQAIPVPEVSR